MIAEFKARIQCKHCSKRNHYSDLCFEIQRKQKEESLKAFLIQSGLSEESVQKAVEDPKKTWKDQQQKGPKAGPKTKNTSGPAASSAGAGVPSAETGRMQEDTESQPRKGREFLHFQKLRKLWTCFEQLSRMVSCCDYPWLWRRRCVMLFWILVQQIPLSLHHWCQIRIAGVTVQSGSGRATIRTMKERIRGCVRGQFYSSSYLYRYAVRLAMNFIRQNAKTFLGLIFILPRLIVKNPETHELSLVSLSDKCFQKEGGNRLPPAQASSRMSRSEA